MGTRVSLIQTLDMCRPIPYVHKLYPLFREFPLLASTRCMKAIIYRLPSTSKIVCTQCYDKINRPRQMQRGRCHAAVFGAINEVTCDVCKKSVNSFESLKNCDECFTGMLDHLRTLKDQGMDVNNLDRFILNILAGTVTRLSFSSPPDTLGMNTALLDHEYM